MTMYTGQSNSPRTVAFVLQSFVKAGSQRHFLEILKSIKLYQSNVRCDLFIVGQSDSQKITFYADALHSKISVRSFPYVTFRTSGLGILSLIFNWVSRNFAEKLYNRRLLFELSGYDAVVCCEPFTADLLFSFLKGRGQRVVFHLNEHVAQRKSKLLEKLLLHSDIPVVLMHESQLLDFPAVSLRHEHFVFPLGVCSDSLSANISACRYSQDEALSIVHYARISPMRHIDKFIEAFAILRRSVNARLRIVGMVEDSNYFNRLTSLIRYLRLEQLVTFEDAVDSIAGDYAYNCDDLAWVLSVGGHIGYGGIEAIMTGIPVICLDLGQAQSNISSGMRSFLSFTDVELAEKTSNFRSRLSSLYLLQKSYAHNNYILKSDSVKNLVSFYLGQDV